MIGTGDERGVTLVETMVAMLITSILLVAFYGFFFAFSDDVGRQERWARTLEATRPVMAELVLRLRQAVDVDGDGAIVDRLDSSWQDLELVFFSDRFDAEGPERFRYHLEGCADGRCDLVVSITTADPGSGPDWTYTSVAHTRTLLENVVADGSPPLFVGVTTGPSGSSTITSCGGATPCDFERLRIVLRVDSDPLRAQSPIVELFEEVRFRNAQ